MRLKVLIAFLVTMFLSGSALATLAIIAVYFLSRSITWSIQSPSGPSNGAALMLIDYDPLQRGVVFFMSLGSMDFEQILEADHSSALRIAPLIYLRICQ